MKPGVRNLLFAQGAGGLGAYFTVIPRRPAAYIGATFDQIVSRPTLAWNAWNLYTTGEVIWIDGEIGKEFS